MTGRVMYEKTGKTTVKLNQIFEKNHKPAIALRSIPAGIAIGVLMLFLFGVAMYGNGEDGPHWFFAYIYNTLHPAAAIVLGIACVLAVCSVYVYVSVLILSRKFENTRGSYVRYRLCRQELYKINDEESSV